MRLFLVVTCSFVSLSPAFAQTSETDKTLLAKLWQNPQFADRIPDGNEISGFTRTGGIVSGPLMWGPNPNELAIVPKGIKTERSINCDRKRIRTYDGTVAVKYTDIYSFTTTEGASIAAALNVSASWPGAEIGYSLTATVSTSTDETNQSGAELDFDHSYVAAVDPRHYVDAQLQVIEQQIEGQPFEVDIEISGNAEIKHRPAVQWLDRSSAGRAALVKAGSEPATGDKRRDLHICRARHNDATHPGKIVANKCNYGYGGKEKVSSRYEVLSMPDGSYRWISREDFEKDNDDIAVANGESLAVIGGKEDRVDRYDGQLVVCRAEHKGDYHPGKVVINDCMIGYGGREYEKSNYQVLMRKDAPEESFTIALIDYIDREDLSFRVKGKFEGAHGLDSSIIVADQRPVDGTMCADTLTDNLAADVPADLEREINVTRNQITAPVAKAYNSANNYAAVNIGRDTGQKITPTPAEEPLDGQLLSTAGLAPGSNPIDYSIRTLRRTKPFMRGADVLIVQRALTAAGWPVLQDGVYGGYTEEAVRLYQRSHGLHADGVFGPGTEIRLGL